jgi:hypothetical protein
VAASRKRKRSSRLTRLRIGAAAPGTSRERFDELRVFPQLKNHFFPEEQKHDPACIRCNLGAQVLVGLYELAHSSKDARTRAKVTADLKARGLDPATMDDPPGLSDEEAWAMPYGAGRSKS